MLSEQKRTREALRRIVFTLSANHGLDDDLTPEALIHLWLRETQRPGQTQSWYFQSCRFFLQNHLRNGRSVDSARRQMTLCLPVNTADFNAGSAPDESPATGSVLALVSAREIISLLGKWLAPQEFRVLNCLADGFGVREIAARLNVSHTLIIRCRRRIAALALKLGIEPLPSRNGQRQKKNCILTVPLGPQNYFNMER